MKIDKSIRVFIYLIILLSAFSSINVFLPQGEFLADVPMPGSKAFVATISFFMVLLIYGGLGLAGIILSRQLGISDLFDREVNDRQRYLIPLIAGVLTGAFFVLADLVFVQFHSLGDIPHPPFPTSLIASASAGIGEETIFRLFFISFFYWLFCKVFFNDRFSNLIFWLVAIFSAIAFASGHLPSAMMLLGLEEINEIPTVILIEIFLLNGVLSIICAHYFRKYGFLAAVGVHFWTDIIWHVIYGLF